MKKRLVSTITALVMLAFTAINQGLSGEAEQTENSAFTITSHAAALGIRHMPAIPQGHLPLSTTTPRA